MEMIDAGYLLAFGILLIGFEAIIPSFVTVWLGLGFLIVSGLTYFGLFENGIVQIASSITIGFVLALVLRKWSMTLINKSQDDTEEKIHTGGVGIVEDGSIKLNGTYWTIDDDISNLKNGDKIEVIIIDNKAKISK